MNSERSAEMRLGHWLGLILVLIALYVLWQLRSLVVIVLAAVLLANALSGAVRLLQRQHHWPRSLAVLTTVLLSGLILLGFFLLVVPPVLEQIEELPAQVMKGVERLDYWWTQLQTGIDWPESIAVPTLDDFTVQLPELANNLLGEGWSWFSNTVSGLLNSLLVLVLTFMILADPDPYRRSFLRLFPAFYRQRADQILDECDRVLQHWLESVMLNLGVITLLSFMVLLSLQIPLALSQAVIAGLLTLIPTLGTALSVLPPMAIALLDQPWKSLVVLVLYLAIHQFEHNILSPYLMGRSPLPPPAITLLGQLFFIIAFGLPGLILSLPLTLVGKVWFDAIVLQDILTPWQQRDATPQQQSTAPALSDDQATKST